MVGVTDGEVGAYGTGRSGTPPLWLYPSIDLEVWDAILSGLVRSHRVIRYDAHSFRCSPQPTAVYSHVDGGDPALGGAGVQVAVGLAGRGVAVAVTVPGGRGGSG